tara:strand:- start:274 stop:705 length:432 start_codon:yes stop_codon:yes gene_type:complete
MYQKLTALLFVFTFLFLIGCVNDSQILDQQDTQNLQIIPADFQNPNYCKDDSDCILISSDSQCKIDSVNKFHSELSYNGIKGHTQCVPWKFQELNCINNRCSYKLDCSKCIEVNQYMQSIGCFREKPNILAQFACSELSRCDC